MKPENQRIKIAKICGWRDIKTTGGFIYPRALTGLIPADSQRLPLPDLPNLILDAESALGDADSDLHMDYVMMLRSLTGSINAAVTAAANIRAEAFLRVHHEWGDETTYCNNGGCI